MEQLKKQYESLIRQRINLEETIEDNRKKLAVLNKEIKNLEKKISKAA